MKNLMVLALLASCALFVATQPKVYCWLTGHQLELNEGQCHCPKCGKVEFEPDDNIKINKHQDIHVEFQELPNGKIIIKRR